MNHHDLTPSSSKQESLPLAGSVAQAAALLGLGSTTVWACIAAGLIPSVRVGKRTLVKFSALESFLSLPQAEIDEALRNYKTRRDAGANR